MSLANTRLFGRAVIGVVMGAGLLFATSFLGGQAAAPPARTPAVQTKASQAETTPARALEMLKEGNVRFASGRALHRDLPAKIKLAAPGQYPFAAVISCMDSRAPTEVIFDQTLGDLFTLRIAGNIVNPDFLGSLEYAGKVIGSKLLLVLGHSDCGAVKGAIDRVQLGNLTGLLAKIEPAVAAAGPGTSKDAAYVSKVAEQNVRLTIKRIRDESPVLKELLDKGALGLAGGMYDLQTGKVTIYAD